MARNRYLRKKTDRYVFPWNEVLAGRGDMFECDKEGNLLSGLPTTAAVELGINPETAPELEIKTIDTMNDVELEVYALDNFGVDIDRRRSIYILRAQVAGLEDGTLSKEDVMAGRFEPVAEDEKVETKTEESTETVTTEDVQTDVEEKDLLVMPDFTGDEFSRADVIAWAKENGVPTSGIRKPDKKERVIAKIESKVNAMNEPDED